MNDIELNTKLLDEHIVKHQNDNKITRQNLAWDMDIDQTTLFKIHNNMVGGGIQAKILYKICKVLKTKMEDYIIDKNL